MQIFKKLRKLRALQRRLLPDLETLQDFDILGEIGYHEERGAPVTLRQLLLRGIGSVATVQRRLQRLKRLGLVLPERSPRDKRRLHLRISAGVRSAYAQKELLLRSR